MERVGWRFVGVMVVAGLGAQLGCGGGEAELPSGATGVPAANLAKGAPVSALTNAPPAIELRTQPAYAEGDPLPVIVGVAPLEVTFNLCRSTDPDQEEDGSGDSLTWQFHFGDDGTAAWNPDGSFNPHVSHHCRVTHTYAEGTYTATVSVTDKHLEDQSHDVAAFARDTLQVTIEAGGEAPAPPPPAPDPTPVLYCHDLPGWCTAATQFCQAEPIDHTSSAHAQNACETCFDTSCTDVVNRGNAWAANGYKFFYVGSGGHPWATFCSSGGYAWYHAAGDIDFGGCGAGTW